MATLTSYSLGFYYKIEVFRVRRAITEMSLPEMSLPESIDFIAEAIVTVKRALEHGVIDEKKYKGLIDHLSKQKAVYGVEDSDIMRANNGLDELEYIMNLLMSELSDELFNMAEKLLADYEKEVGKDDDDMLREAETNARESHKREMA